MDTTERENDFPTAKFLFLAADPNSDADSTADFKNQTGGRGAVHDCQVAAAAHGSAEIADRRRGALLRRVAHRHGAIAVAKVRIHVGDERNLPLLREDMHRL